MLRKQSVSAALQTVQRGFEEARNLPGFGLLLRGAVEQRHPGALQRPERELDREVARVPLRSVSTVTQVKRGSTFALRRSTLNVCLGGQRSCKGNRGHWTGFRFFSGFRVLATIEREPLNLKSGTRDYPQPGCEPGASSLRGCWSSRARSANTPASVRTADTYWGAGFRV